jgi:hypothetical protein
MDPSSAVSTLWRALSREASTDSRQTLARGIANVAERLGPGDAAGACSGTLALLWRDLFARVNQGDIAARSFFDSTALTLIDHLESAPRHELVVALTRLRLGEHDANYGTASYYNQNTSWLVELLSDSSRPVLMRRAERTAMRMVIDGPVLAAAQDAVEPYPCELTTQELVDLLKMPTCFGPTRRVVLDQLGNVHGRRFDHHWQFVRFARERNLKLDFTAPPERADPKHTIARMMALLGDPEPMALDQPLPRTSGIAPLDAGFPVDPFAR